MHVESLLFPELFLDVSLPCKQLQRNSLCFELTQLACEHTLLFLHALFWESLGCGKTLLTSHPWCGPSSGQMGVAVNFTGRPPPVGLKPEKPVILLPVTTRTNKQRQGLNLYGRFIQMAGDLRRRQLMCPQKPS